MSESVISTMDNTAFFDNVTWLNQQNWQNYFGKTLPNGVIVNGSLKLSGTGYMLSGTMDITSSQNNIIVGTGAVMANGLYAENLLPVQTPHVTQAESTKFICVRFDLENANAKIVCKTNVVGSGETLQNVIRALNVDESYLCDRNTSVYEIPLAFESYNGDILDLRRLVYAPSGEKHYLDLTSGKGINNSVLPGVVRGQSHAQVFGGTTYYITIDSTDVDNNFILYPMFVSSTEPIIVCIINNSGSMKNLTLSNSANGYMLNYDWIDSWQTNTYGTYTEFVSGTSKILVLFPVKITTSGATFGVLTKGSAEGGSVDPDSVYTKQEINNLLAQKANGNDINSALALKEDITNLGALAYQNRVNYLTQIDNKPDQNNIIDVTYYVSRVNGSDGNLGTQESPFKTIQHAIDSVGINCIGTIIIASDTYTEKLEIKGKHIILKQAELPEEIVNIQFNTKIEIGANDSAYTGHHVISITDNSFVKFIGHFTIYGKDLGILIDEKSSLNFGGSYSLRQTIDGSVIITTNYCLLEVDLHIPCHDWGFNDLYKYNGHCITIKNSSQFITDSYNTVSISNTIDGLGCNVSGFGIIVDKSFCYIYDAQFSATLYYYVYCRGGVFRYYQSNRENRSNFNIDGVIKSLDFGSLAYKNTVNYETEVTNKPTFGTLASKNSVNYETEITNKPTLGTLSSQNDVTNENMTYVKTIGGWKSIGHSSTSLYVDRSEGDDTTGNGDSYNPYKTIQKAIDVAMIGVKTTINILPGDYSEDIKVQEGKIIVLKAPTPQPSHGFNEVYISRKTTGANNYAVEVIGGSLIFDEASFHINGGIKVTDFGTLFVKCSVSSTPTPDEEFILTSSETSGILITNGSRASLWQHTTINTSNKFAIECDNGGNCSIIGSGSTKLQTGLAFALYAHRGSVITTTENSIVITSNKKAKAYDGGMIVYNNQILLNGEIDESNN